MTAKTAKTAIEKRIEAENTVIRSFVHHILAAPGNLTISINDGESWCVKKSRDKEAILKEMRSTDMDTLRVRRADGTLVGDVIFVYGNAGYEVMNDHTDTEEMRQLIAQPLQTMENQKY